MLKIRNGKNIKFVNNVSLENVRMAIDDIKSQSKILNELYEDGKIDIVGAMYHHTTGEVVFCD